MSDMPTRQPEKVDGETYEIRVRGHLDERWATRLAVQSLTHDDDGTTTLRVVGTDQAALHGLLRRLGDLGLTLVWVLRIHAAFDDPSEPNSSSTRILR
jgi:hypothetical protein